MRYLLLWLILIPASALPCGTPCTQLGQSGYLDADGACILSAQTARIDSFSWSSSASNTSTLVFDADVACLCGEYGLCNITIGSDDTIQEWSDQLQDYAYDSPPLEYGSTPVMLNCTCNSTNVSSTYNATTVLVQAQVMSISFDPITSPSHSYQTKVSVKNAGNIASSFTVYDQDHEADNCTAELGDALSSQNSTILDLSPLGEAGDYDEAVFLRTMACGYSGKALHLVQVCESTLGCPGTNSTGGCFDVYECYDYGGEWDPDLDCASCGLASHACSNFHCCPYGSHWENGACCGLGQLCCTQDSDCPSSFRCNTVFNHCVGLGGVGETCSELDDCQSNFHCDSNSSLPFSYCTYNTSSDAGLPPDQCWDEEEWNLSDPYYGCDGCQTTLHCLSTYYCAESYAFCRTCPSGAGSIDGVCEGSPDLNCFGLDQDCCSDNSNCTSLGDGYYCETSSKVCRQCQTRQDYYCPDALCYGTDPDCCLTGITCPAGTVCDDTGTCVPQTGSECALSSDCGVGNLECGYSACAKKSVCMLPTFINIQPSVVPKALTIGQSLPVSVQVSDPQGCPSTYRLYFTGPSRYSGFFGSGSQEFSFTLEPGKTLTVPARISASALGRLSIEINVVDTANPNLHDLVTLEADVQGYSADVGEVVTSPDSSVLSLGFLLAGALALYAFRRDY